MRVTPVACLRDNYAYLVEGAEAGSAIVVDPSEAPPVEEALAARGLKLVAIWATHHHLDHVGGVAGLSASRPGLAVYAFEGEAPRIAGVTHRLGDGETFSLLGLRVRALHIPGHTLGAVAYVADEGGAPAVFTGDTLFCAGCGRLFEGTPAQMHESLSHVLGALPDDALVYCGHEYTEANLGFAAHVEPANEAVSARAVRVAAARAKGLPSVPSTMADERATNPFLRVTSPAVRAFAGAPAGASDAEVFARIRAAKDAF